MVRGSELAVVLSVCEETNGRLVPLRFGYLRVHLDDDGSVFLAISPADTAIAPIAIKLHLDMTIGEAIEAIGPDGTDIANWVQRGAA